MIDSARGIVTLNRTVTAVNQAALSDVLNIVAGDLAEAENLINNVVNRKINATFLSIVARPSFGTAFIYAVDQIASGAVISAVGMIFPVGIPVNQAVTILPGSVIYGTVSINIGPNAGVLPPLGVQGCPFDYFFSVDYE